MGSEVLPQAEEFKYLWVLFMSLGRMEQEIDRGNWCSILSEAGSTSVCLGEKGATVKNEALDLLIDLLF